MTRPLVALAAFVTLAVLVATRGLAAMDRALLDAVQGPHATWLDIAASVVTLFGQTELIGTIALAVGIAWWRHGRAGWWLPVGLAVTIAVETIFKQTLPQPAPPSDLSRGIELLPFIRPATAYSFPSGHVARVAFLVTALRWPTPLAAAGIAVMALASVYLANHWPTDVLGGWLLGYITGALIGRRATSMPSTPGR